MAERIRRYRAAGGVVVRGDQVLLLNRPSRGEVRLPKGHVEPGEEDREAALREVREETGYQRLRVVCDLGVQRVEFDNPWDGHHYIRQEHYFLMCLEGAEQAPRPPGDAQFSPFWAPLDRAAELLTFESERAVLRRAREIVIERAPCASSEAEEGTRA